MEHGHARELVTISLSPQQHATLQQVLEDLANGGRQRTAATIRTILEDALQLPPHPCGQCKRPIAVGEDFHWTLPAGCWRTYCTRCWKQYAGKRATTAHARRDAAEPQARRAAT